MIELSTHQSFQLAPGVDGLAQARLAGVSVCRHLVHQNSIVPDLLEGHDVAAQSMLP